MGINDDSTPSADLMVVDTPSQPRENDGNEVIVPLYSRFSFEDVPVNASNASELLEKVKAALGEEWENLAELNDDQSFVTIKSPPDISGRGRLPNGATASDTSKWNTKLVFPDSGEELSADEADMSAEEIVSRNGRVVCVIPVTFSLGGGAVPLPQAKA
jgi:hypothetical protein